LVSQIANAAERDGGPQIVHGTGGVGATGMWTFLATDAMGFGGLLIAYGMLRVRAGVDTWPDPRARLALAPAAAMTFALLLSSLTMSLATRARTVAARRAWLLATLALGVAFLGGGAFEYAHLLGGVPAMGLTSDLFASTFYLVTGFHALHVLAGVVAVSFMLRAKFGAQALETTALYWHFVDAAWMPIFSIIYLWPAR
jgi:heme/copper-type cytochrome/quinol oxidase subunit 3